MDIIQGNMVFVANSRSPAEHHGEEGLPIPESLVIIDWLYIARVRLHHRHTNVYSHTF